MNQKLKVFLAILALMPLVAVTSVAAEDFYDEEGKVSPRLELEMRYWWPDLNGSFKATDSGSGSGIDLKSDLGIKDEGTIDPRLKWYTGPNSWVRASYIELKYKGARTLSRTIEFAGDSYTIGADVESTADLMAAKASWAWEFIQLADDKVKLGTIVEVAFTRVAEIGIRTANGLIENEKDYSFPAPAIGGVLDVAPWEWANFYLEAAGIPLGQYGHTLNVEGGVKIIPIKHASLEAGYRYSDVEYDNEPNYLRLKLSGPYAAASVRF